MIGQHLFNASLLAHICGHSLPIRKTARLSRNLASVGIAPIRVAGDDRLQAVAYGTFHDSPTIVTIVNPNDTDQPGLDLVGEFLAQHLAREGGCQVWVPDQTSLAVLAFEGQRSRRNPRLSPGRQKFGVACYALARLHQLPSQQIVAVATEVLGWHLITGQSASENAHLAARLAWDDPVPGASPAVVAAQRRMHPGPSLLPPEDDEIVEALRSRMLRSTVSESDSAETNQILRRGARQAWELLAQARAVYHNLPLVPLSGQTALENASRQELSWLVSRSPAFGAHLGATRAEFLKREFWRARLEDLEARSDANVREVLREEGRVVSATILRVREPQRAGQACRILVATSQPELRIRPGTKLKTGDDRVQAIVDTIRYRRGPTLILLRLTTGKRAARLLPIGGEVDWFDTVLFRGRQPAAPQIARLEAIPSGNPVSTVPTSGDLLRLARRLRRR